MVSFGLDSLETADRLSAEPSGLNTGLNGGLNADDGTTADLGNYSQAQIAQFVNGVSHLLDKHAPEEFASLAKATPEDLMKDMTPGEALITYDIMHNPIMEEIAIAHASDAMAFANDVMLNFSRAIDQKQNAYQANLTVAEIEDMGDDADDEDLTPAQKARKRAADMERRMREIGNDLQEQRIEEQKEAARKEWDNAEFHEFGGKKWNPQDLLAFFKWTDDPANLDAVDAELAASGMSKEQIKSAREKFEEAKRLEQKKRDGTATQEELRRLEELKKDQELQMYVREAEKIRQKELTLSNQNDKANASLQASSSIESRQGRSNIATQLDENKKDIVEATGALSLDGLLDAKKNIAKYTQLSDKSKTENLTSADQAKLNELQSAETTSPAQLANIRQNAGITVAFNDDFGSGDALPVSNALQNEFIAANAATSPLDQEQPLPESKVQTTQLAMNQQAAGLNF
ncbi:MAG: hypothetical protein RBR86_03475 [Pseudobdellovibrionaceae bacterium]|jgi:hypothetical protein|nr:hypothetical protein [Pseudobdellovibrionaceae bacterium]